MRTYPSQENCQLLLDIQNRASIHTGYATDKFKALGDKANSLPVGFNKLFKEAFGPKSPWNVRVKHAVKGTKRELYWDKEKAQKLGI